MLTNCLAEYAHLTITVSQIKRDIGRKSSFFHTPWHLTPPLGGGGSRRHIATPFGVKKARIAWLPDGEKKFEDIFIRFGRTHERDRHTYRQTHRQTPHAGIYRAYAYASRGKHSIKYCCLVLLSPAMSDQLPPPGQTPLGHNLLVFCRSWVGWGQDPHSWVG